MKKKIHFPKPSFYKDDELPKLTAERLEFHIASLMAYLECEHGVEDETIEQFFKSIAVISVRNWINEFK